MADIVNLEKQDLINLSKVLSLDSRADVPYILNGQVYSSYQRHEKVYRLHVNDSDIVYLFIFNKKNRVIGIVEENIKDFNDHESKEPNLVDNSHKDIEK